VPITDYSAGVWGFKSYDKIDVLHHKIIRYFFGVHRFAANHAIEGDMGWVPPSVRRLVSVIRLWNRLIDMPQDRLTRKIFDWDYSVCKNNWSFEVKKILENCNLLYMYNECSICDTVIVKDKLMEQYVEKWETERGQKLKLRTYNMYKWGYCVEDYVSMNIDKYTRSLIAQSRFGILPLQIEVGRYRGIPINERLCVFCANNEIEDEFHLIMLCTFYEVIRNELFCKVGNFDRNFNGMDNFDRFILICNKFQKFLGQFLVKAIQKRNNHLYA